MNDLELKTALIHLLIQLGCAINESKYNYTNQNDPTNPVINIIKGYSQDLDASWPLTKLALEDFQEHGINYEQSSNVQDGTEKGFDGTFNDGIRIPVLKGIIVSNSGFSYCWGTIGSYESSLSILITALQAKRDLPESLNRLKSRMNKILENKHCKDQLSRDYFLAKSSVF